MPKLATIQHTDHVTASGNRFCKAIQINRQQIKPNDLNHLSARAICIEIWTAPAASSPLTVPSDRRHVHTMASTIFRTRSTIFTMRSDFWRCRCEYVRQDRSSDRALNEFVSDGHSIPLTTLPRLNAEQALLLNGGRFSLDLLPIFGRKEQQN